MKSSPQTYLTLKTLQRVAVCLAIVGVLLSSLGVVVVSTPKSNSSQAYMCQGGTCGCSSAAQCWSNCCCTTVAERLVWAEANQVTPPDDVAGLLAAADDRPAAGSSGDPPDDVGLNRSDRESKTREDSPAAFGPRVVLLSNASDCRGLPQYIAVFGSVICQAVPAAAHPPLLMTGWIRTADASTNSPLTSPPTPPPRLHV